MLRGELCSRGYGFAASLSGGVEWLLPLPLLWTVAVGVALPLRVAVSAAGAMLTGLPALGKLAGTVWLCRFTERICTTVWLRLFQDQTLR